MARRGWSVRLPRAAPGQSCALVRIDAFPYTGADIASSGVCSPRHPGVTSPGGLAPTRDGGGLPDLRLGITALAATLRPVEVVTIHAAEQGAYCAAERDGDGDRAEDGWARGAGVLRSKDFSLPWTLRCVGWESRVRTSRRSHRRARPSRPVQSRQIRRR